MSGRPVGLHPANTAGFVPLIGNSIEIAHSTPEYGSVSPRVEMERMKPQSETRVQNMCQIILLVVVVCVIVCGLRRYIAPPSSFVVARRAQLGVVDMHVKLPPATQEKLFVARKPTDVGVLHNLTACSDANCVTDSSKAENEDKIRAFLEANSKAMIMVFAPWCPACTKALPEYANAAETSSMPMAIINADIVPQSLLVGPDSLMNLQYFPHVAKYQNGELSEFEGHITRENLLNVVAE